VERVLKPYLANAEAAFLLVHQHRVHMMGDFVHACNDLGCDVDYIPAGYTCVLQPVDVGVNAPFKSALRDYNHAWKTINYCGITNVDKFPTPEREDVYPWIINAFSQITSESIVRTFQHIGFL